MTLAKTSIFFFFSSRRRHTRLTCDWSSTCALPISLAQVVAEELGLRPQDVTVRIGDTAFPAGPASGGSVTTGSITPPARNAAFKVKQQFAEQIAQAFGTEPEWIVLKGGSVLVYDIDPRWEDGDTRGRSYKAAPVKTLSFRQAASKLRTEQIAARADRSKDYNAVGGAAGGRGMYGGAQVAEGPGGKGTGGIKGERGGAGPDRGGP